jgi:hypothetical protein
MVEEPAGPCATLYSVGGVAGATSRYG